MFENPEIAFGSNHELLSLIELIYSAVGQPELWQKVLERISDAARGDSTVLWARFPMDSLIALTRFAPGSWEQYAEYYSGVNVLMPRCDDRFPEGTVRYSHLVMGDAEFEKTEFYADFFRRWDMHFSFGIKVPLGELPSAYISCQRPKARGPFEEREGLVYQTLLPHMQRALRLHLNLSHMRAKTEGLETALDAFGHAVLGVNDEGRVILANREAQHLISDGGSLCLRNGLLRASLSELDNQLQAMLRDASGAGPIPSTFSEGALTISRGVLKTPLRVVISRYCGRLPGSIFSIAALIFVIDPGKAPRSRASILRHLFGLTPTESRIADLLLQGLEIREVGESLTITEQTTRFHVKRILAKTGTKRQSELLRVMMSFPSSEPMRCE